MFQTAINHGTARMPLRTAPLQDCWERGNLDHGRPNWQNLKTKFNKTYLSTSLRRLKHLIHLTAAASSLLITHIFLHLFLLFQKKILKESQIYIHFYVFCFF